MSIEQQQQAKTLYFQTDLTKTQIAELLSIPRNTIHYWIRQKNWDRLKKASSHMPSLLAENCYHIIARFSEHLLSESRIMRPVTYKEADTLHKLALTATKLKNRATLNENMETFGCFMETVNRKSPKLAKEIMPFVDEYIDARAAINAHQFLPDNMNSMGLIPDPDQNNEEKRLDLQDIMEWDLQGALSADIEQFRFKNDPLDAMLEAKKKNTQPQTSNDQNPQPSTQAQSPEAAQHAPNTNTVSDQPEKTNTLTTQPTIDLDMVEEILKNRPFRKAPQTEQEFRDYWKEEQATQIPNPAIQTPAAVAA